MQFDEVISNRKTIRKYIPKEVSKELLLKIINSARLAPSAKNRQPWRFYILNNVEKKHIINLMYQWEQENPNEKSSIKGSAKQMKQADKVILIYSPIYKNKNKKLYYKKPDYLSLGAAIENMCLTCTNLGLGSCWCCDILYIENEINSYLNINNYELISGLMIGHPEIIPQSSPRMDLDKLIFS